MEQMIKKVTDDDMSSFQQTFFDKTQTLGHLAKSLLHTLQVKDPLTMDHSLKVADYCRAIATELGLNQDDINNAYLAGLFHDIGKMCIPHELLYKTGKLKDVEIRTILQHPTLGANIVTKISQLKNIANAIKYHHERWNGKGYPYKLQGENIPILSRIIGVADSFDAITSNRTYHVVKTYSKAASELLQESNTLYDPEVVNAFINWMIRNNLVDVEQFTTDRTFYKMLTDKISNNKTEGLAWVLAGRIFVQDPLDNHSRATIVPCPEVQLIHDWMITTGQVEVSQNDAIEVIPDNTRTPGSINVVLAKDKMSAQLDIKPDRIGTYVLQDSFPVNKLKLKVKPIVKEVFNYTINLMQTILQEHNVVHGIDEDTLSGLIENPRETIITVAKGTPPGNTIDDKVKVVWDNSLAENTKQQEQVVNYRERKRIPSVSVGETIAVVHYGIQGTDGITVTNEIFKAREPKRVKVKAGRGTKLSEDGLRIIATIDGRPRVSKVGLSWTFNVEPILVIPHPVNIETGNIYFKGDIKILESVENGMSVSASGNVEVFGLATECKITAGANITMFSTVINSSITGGALGVIEEKIRPKLTEYVKNLNAMYLSATMLLEKAKGTETNYGKIISVLLENKFKHIPKLIEELAKLCKGLDLKILGENEGTINVVLKMFSGINTISYVTPKLIQKKIIDLQYLLDHGFSKIEKPYIVRINKSLNSTIMSTGDVIVDGSECYNTIIKAKGNVKIDGVMRGGLIEAKGNVQINEVGSIAGTKTIVSVGKGKVIKAKRAYSGVTFKVGKQAHILIQDDQNISVSLDEEGYIRIIRSLY